MTRVLPRRGVAGFWRGDENTSDNVFVAPGTIAGAARARQRDLGAPPQSMVLVSNRGGVIAGADATAAVSRALTAARLGSLPYTLDAAKASLLERADRSGDSLSQIYSSLGTFGVLAGILLARQHLLHAGRRAEVGARHAARGRPAARVARRRVRDRRLVLRAGVGGRGHVRRARAGSSDDGVRGAAATERSRFRATAAAVRVHVGERPAGSRDRLRDRDCEHRADERLAQSLQHHPGDPRHHGHAAALARTPASYVAGGLLAAGGGVLTRARRIRNPLPRARDRAGARVRRGSGRPWRGTSPARTSTTALAAAVLFWGLVAVPIALALQSDVDVFMFVAQGLMLVGAAVVLVSQQQHAIGHAVGRVAKRSLDVRLGLAYPLARRFRTAMTLGMFALVVFILVYVSVIGAMFAGQLNRFTADASGGFNVDRVVEPERPGCRRRARAVARSTCSRTAGRTRSSRHARAGPRAAAAVVGHRIRRVLRAQPAAFARRPRSLPDRPRRVRGGARRPESGDHRRVLPRGWGGTAVAGGRYR